MPGSRQRSKGHREPLTRERVFRAAVDEADSGGIGSVTMRKVADRLGVEAMSLYHHVPNKEGVLDGMVDAVFDEIEVPEPGSDWKDAMRQRAVSAREVLSRHPWAVAVMDSRRSPGPATLRHHNAVLGCLREAGFSIEGAAHAFALLDSYIYGFSMQDLSLPFEPGDDLQVLAEEILGAMQGDYPYLAEMVTEHALAPGYDFGDEYAFGLDLILDGLEARR